MSTRCNSSPVWAYMEKQGDYSICRICQTAIKHGMSTSSMIKHIQYKHPNEYEELFGHTETNTTQDRRSKSIYKKPTERLFGKRANWSPVWKYMDKLGDFAICRLCSSTFSSQSGTSQLINHLKRRHMEECEDMFQIVESNTVEHTVNSSIAAVEPRASTMLCKLNKCEEPRKELLKQKSNSSSFWKYMEKIGESFQSNISPSTEQTSSAAIVDLETTAPQSVQVKFENRQLLKQRSNSNSFWTYMDKIGQPVKTSSSAITEEVSGAPNSTIVVVEVTVPMTEHEQDECDNRESRKDEDEEEAVESDTRPSTEQAVMTSSCEFTVSVVEPTVPAMMCEQETCEDKEPRKELSSKRSNISFWRFGETVEESVEYNEYDNTSPSVVEAASTSNSESTIAADGPAVAVTAEEQDKCDDKEARAGLIHERSNRSPVWKCMARIEDSVICRICKSILPYRGGTSNLLKHIKSKHPKQCDKLFMSGSFKMPSEDDEPTNVLMERTNCSPVWKYMKKDGTKATCLFCKQIFTYQTTSNLLKHLKRKHAIEGDKLPEPGSFELPHEDDEPRHLVIQRTNCSPVWKYMKKDETTAACLFCKKLFALSSTSNLLKHLKSKHAEECDGLFEISSSQVPTTSTIDCHPAQKDRTNSPVWKYMERDGGSVLCRICKSTFGFSHNTTTLMNHLKTRHAKECEELFEPVWCEDSSRTSFDLLSQASVCSNDTDMSAESTVEPAVPTAWDKQSKCEDKEARKLLLKERGDSGPFGKTRANRSFVWNYMKKNGHYVTCQLCKSRLTHSQISTSNMMKHLKLKHPEECEELYESHESRSRLDMQTTAPVTRSRAIKASFPTTLDKQDKCEDNELPREPLLNRSSNRNKRFRSLWKYMKRRRVSVPTDQAMRTKAAVESSFTTILDDEEIECDNEEVNEQLSDKRANRSRVWDYMEKLKTFTICRLCKRTFRCTSSTSNLLKHLAKTHPKECKNLFNPVKSNTTVSTDQLASTDMSKENECEDKESGEQLLDKRLTRSPAWNYMERHGTSVICKICKFTLKYSGGTSNLFKHLRKMHLKEYQTLFHPVECDTAVSTNQSASADMSTNATTLFKQSERADKEPGCSSSSVFKYMERLGDSALCRLCYSTFRCPQGTSNLVGHLKTEHPKEYENLLRAAESTETSQVLTEVAARSAILAKLDKLRRYVDIMPRKQLLDMGVLLIVTEDLQPFTLVERDGFVRLVHNLDPEYELPSRQYFAKKLLPLIYEETKLRIKQELMDVKTVAITTDIWTSWKARTYLTVTCHFVTGEWDLKTYVLETVRLADAVTPANIAEELNNVMTGWDIRQKVCAVVTDNGTNIAAAVEQLKLTHVACFVHTFHLVVTEAIKKVEEVAQAQQRVQHIVNHYQTSVKFAKKLENVQKSHGREVKKLVQAVETRFNSIFAMLKRYDEEAEMISIALHSLDRQEMCLTDSDNNVVKKTISALEPCEQIIKELSAENFTPASKVLPIIQALIDYYSFIYSDTKENQLAAELLNQLKQHFASLEERFPVAECTYLDPRFKKLPFSNTDALKLTEDRIIKIMQTAAADSQEVSDHLMTEEVQETLEQVQPMALEVWTRFDKRVSVHLNTPSQSLVRPQLDVHLYSEEKLVKRDKDPLQWWKENQTSLPKLQGVAKRVLCIPATSVPAERLFSKTGELFSRRRRFISASSINKVLFLNKNF